MLLGLIQTLDGPITPRDKSHIHFFYFRSLICSKSMPKTARIDSTLPIVAEPRLNNESQEGTQANMATNDGLRDTWILLKHEAIMRYGMKISCSNTQTLHLLNLMKRNPEKDVKNAVRNITPSFRPFPTPTKPVDAA